MGTGTQPKETLFPLTSPSDGNQAFGVGLLQGIQVVYVCLVLVAIVTWVVASIFMHIYDAVQVCSNPLGIARVEWQPSNGLRLRRSAFRCWSK